MTPLQLELTKLIGKKEIIGGITFHSGDSISLKQDVSLSDFHRWMNERKLLWEQSEDCIQFDDINDFGVLVPYDSSKDLLDQDEETLKKIVAIITSNK